MLRLLCPLYLLMLYCVPAGAQPPPGEESVLEAMGPLRELVGGWEGEGWVRRGEGEPHRFVSREVVESRLDGRVLIVEGIHRNEDSDRVVHHALAMISWNPQADVYDFRTYVAGRGGGQFEGRLEGDAFVWGGPTGSGTMRYTLVIEGDRWDEIGEFSRDGETWAKFFEMHLRRTGR